MEISRFQKQRFCSICHSAILSAKYPADTHGVFPVTYHQILGIQSTFHPVERNKNAARVRKAYNYFVFFDLIPVKSMQRLTGFE